MATHDETPDETRKFPTPDQPLNAERRPRVVPIIAVVGLVVLIAVIFAIITFVQQHS